MFISPDEALKALVPFVADFENTLWDSSLLFVSKESHGLYEVESIDLHYKSEEDKEFFRSFETKRVITFSHIHKTVYDYLQDFYESVNPKVKWNRLILEVNSKGRYTAHYELDGDEVSPDAPPEPEVMTAEYLCENLQNCLSHNAPDNYLWVWEVLERKRDVDGKTIIGGNFFYSLNPDKSNPQKLEPGEYIYMYTVSERLFDEFFFEETKGWSQIKLEFSGEGKARFYIFRREY